MSNKPIGRGKRRELEEARPDRITTAVTINRHPTARPMSEAEVDIANSFGDKALSWISGVDVGSLAASLLINADAVNDRILIAGGVERLTYDEVASKISAVVGKPIRYEELTPDGWRAALMGRAKAKGGEVNVRGIDHLIAQSIALKSAPALPVTGHVRQITGREPVSFPDFVKQHLAELTASMHE